FPVQLRPGGRRAQPTGRPPAPQFWGVARAISRSSSRPPQSWRGARAISRSSPQSRASPPSPYRSLFLGAWCGVGPHPRLGPLFLEGGVHSQPAFLSRPALPGGGVRSQPAFAPRPALLGGVPAVHSQPAFTPRPAVPGGGVRSQLAASTGFPIEVGTEPRGVSNYPFTPHFNMPPTRRRKLRSLPPLHNFNLVHFKRPITTTSEHNLFLELYMKHATKGGTNYRAVLMEFNSAVVRQLWGLAQGGYQQAIDSDLYFKDYRDITRYERQLVRSLLSREADNTSVALSSAFEHASTSPTGATVTPPSSPFPPQTLGCGPLDQGRSNIAASPLEQVDPSSGAPENLVQQYTGPLVVRPLGVESSRPKAGNQGAVAAAPQQYHVEEPEGVGPCGPDPLSPPAMAGPTP
ncbi:hypothetical protein KFL_008150015, partial [Klebsormidium nitens]